MVDYVDEPKEAVAQGVVEGVLVGKSVWVFKEGEVGEGMLCAAEWEEEDEDESVGDEGSGPENICYWPWELHLWPSVCFRVGRWIFA